VPRTTIYGHLNNGSAGTRPRARKPPAQPPQPPRPQRLQRHRPASPPMLFAPGLPGSNRRTNRCRCGKSSYEPPDPPTRGHARHALSELRKRTRRCPSTVAATPRPRHHLATPRR
jgi:hypothetical protein